MDTIFALSSGQPPAAIAVVRISGPRALDAFAAFGVAQPKPRRATLAELRDGEELLDRALILWFEAPKTVTGEELIELHLHGGRAVVAAVMSLLGRLSGFREAEPGEFTRRAFANGRIDLTEAEGLADLLASETQSQRRLALQLAGGALARQVAGWTERLLILAAAIEARLDFSDEGDVGEGLSLSWEQERSALAADIASLLDRPPAERLRDGVRVVIAGPPNSGKSTLLNALVGREAAITSDIAGTTRDLIEAPVSVAGIPLVLIDSAGLRQSADAIEAIGVNRAQMAVEGADLVLWLGEPAHAPRRRGGLIRIRGKADLAPDPGGADLAVSAVTGSGLSELTEMILDVARAMLPPEGEVAANARQRAALGTARVHLDAAAEHTDLLLIAEELRQARLALDQVTGRACVEHMLDALFGRFCIGK